MEKNIKSLSNKYFSSVFFWWFGFVITAYMLSIPEATEGIFKYAISALALYSGIKFLLSILNVLNFIEKNEKQKTVKELIEDILPVKGIKQRSILDYLNKFPAEHPYLILSVMGLILTEQYTGISEHFHRSIENIPVLENISPSLFIVILLLIFSDYTYHINAKYIRRAIKIAIFIYSPFIIVFFFFGLVSPFILIIKGMLRITSLQDIQMYFSGFENIFWLIVYPWTAFYLQKITFIENQKI